MARSAFYSFHFKPDNWRASQVRQMGVVSGNKPANDNDWETIKKTGNVAIQNWIDGQLKGKSVAVVLIGENTADRKWINYEIKKAWNDGKGVLGVYVHKLKDSDGDQASKGDNPFNNFKVDGIKLSNIVKTYDSNYSVSTNVYSYIESNLADWIEDAIEIRKGKNKTDE